MRFPDLILKQKPSDLIVYFLILLHFVGGITSNLAILVTSLWIFFYIVFKREWDIYFIFLLIIPTIVFTKGINLSDSQADTTFFHNFKNVWIIGPFALSSSFAMALAIPIRLIIDFGRSNFKFLTIILFINLILAICGLALAVYSGEQNPSGLTVGFRIVLAIGAILITKAVIDKDVFLKSLDKIILISFLLLVFGFIQAHWFFVAFGFAPYFFHRIKPRILALLPLIFSINILYNLSSTITILAILFVSIVFYLAINYNRYLRRGLANKSIIAFIIIIPLLVTIYTLSLHKSVIYDKTTFKGYIEFKLLADRKPVWDASWKDIWSSSFLVKPAGSHLKVYLDYIKTWEDWTAGSHNIFLEFGRQIGAFSMISLSILLIVFIYRTGKCLIFKNDALIFYCFLSVYLVFGLTGQSLIYDGVGALFWLLFGQFYQVLNSEMKEDHEKSSNLNYLAEY